MPGRLVVDSDLDAFSQYPSHGSLATPADRLIAETRGAARGFLSYYHVLPSSRPLFTALLTAAGGVLALGFGGVLSLLTTAANSILLSLESEPRSRTALGLCCCPALSGRRHTHTQHLGIDLSVAGG
jgi:hypothetical protein